MHVGGRGREMGVLHPAETGLRLGGVLDEVAAELAQILRGWGWRGGGVHLINAI